jgi:hypothetical protein
MTWKYNENSLNSLAMVESYNQKIIPDQQEIEEEIAKT